MIVSTRSLGNRINQYDQSVTMHVTERAFRAETWSGRGMNKRVVVVSGIVKDHFYFFWN